MIVLDHVPADATTGGPTPVGAISPSVNEVTVRLSGTPHGLPEWVVVMVGAPGASTDLVLRLGDGRSAGESVADLGWTREQVVETRAKLSPFEEDWLAPEMDAYDAL